MIINTPPVDDEYHMKNNFINESNQAQLNNNQNDNWGQDNQQFSVPLLTEEQFFNHINSNEQMPNRSATLKMADIVG